MNDSSATDLPILVPRLYRKMTYIPNVPRRFLRPLPARYANRFKYPKQLDSTTERDIMRRVRRALQVEKNRPKEQFSSNDDGSEEFWYQYGNYPRVQQQFNDDFNNDSDETFVSDGDSILNSGGDEQSN